MNGNEKTIRQTLQTSLRSFFADGGPTSAAAISYNALFVLFPGGMALMGLGQKEFLSDERAFETLQAMTAILPYDTRRFIATFFDTVDGSPSWGFILSNLVVYLWAGLWAFHLLEEALSRAWGTPPRASFLRRLLLCSSMLAVSTCCLLASAVTLAGIHWFRLSFLGGAGPAALLLYAVLLHLLVVAYVASTFSLLYRFLPHAQVRWRTALAGGLATGLAWHMTNLAMAFLLPLFDYARVYGSLAAAVAFLVWVYVSCWILILGAHFTARFQARYLPLPGLAAAGPALGEAPAETRP